jgi:FKBP-type peptidyl-prolyl cis-trans isomerase
MCFKGSPLLKYLWGLGITIITIFIISLISGCATSRSGLNIENLDNDNKLSKKPDESIVVGSIDVMGYEGRSINIKRFFSIHKVASNKETSVNFSKNKPFYLIMEPGEYQITGIYRQAILDAMIGMGYGSKVNVYFVVKENEVIYIGKLIAYQDFFWGADPNDFKEVTIVDDYYEADKAFKEKFPDLKKSLKKSLMMTTLQKEKTVILKNLAEKNKEEGEAFLSINRYKEGVITLPSGLQYKVINTGKGKIPNLTDTVEVHYRGTLINGTEFDSSYKRGQMANFTVNRVIPGWIEALQMMKEGDKWQIFVPSSLAYGERGIREGDKWQLFVPSHLAYGERGAGRAIIEPNATLIFEVELIAVK